MAEDDLPSWCPNLTELTSLFKITCAMYGASASQPVVVIVSETTDAITVRGYLVDEIATLITSPYEKISDGGPNTWLAEIDSLIVAGPFGVPEHVLITDEDEDRKWRFLIGNRTLDDTMATPETSRLYAAFKDMSDYARAWSTEAPLPAWTDDLPEIEMWKKTREATVFETGISIMKHGRRAGGTKAGRLAWVPDRAEVGDAICILSGWRAPFVLRRAGGDSWNLLGEAYVEGIMEGEALRDGMAHVQDFKII